ncbi:MAG: hypothetical protein XD49_0661 [Caldanaerobacter subterraneus]|nr:MAG: hypothetical protein XD49_0661 [Caldanaerobacter subterraneus]
MKEARRWLDFAIDDLDSSPFKARSNLPLPVENKNRHLVGIVSSEMTIIFLLYNFI